MVTDQLFVNSSLSSYLSTTPGFSDFLTLLQSRCLFGWSCLRIIMVLQKDTSSKPYRSFFMRFVGDKTTCRSTKSTPLMYLNYHGVAERHFQQTSFFLNFFDRLVSLRRQEKIPLKNLTKLLTIIFVTTKEPVMYHNHPCRYTILRVLNHLTGSKKASNCAQVLCCSSFSALAHHQRIC